MQYIFELMKIPKIQKWRKKNDFELYIIKATYLFMNKKYHETGSASLNGIWF